MPRGTFELYDMRNDPKEQRNAVEDARHREMIADFKKQLTAWRADKPAPVRIAGMKQPDYAAASPEK